MRYIVAVLLAVVSGLALADDSITYRPLVTTQKKDVQVWTSTDLPDGTKQNLGPIIFHRTDDKNRQSQIMTDSIGQALNGTKFRTVPTIWWDKAFDGEGKGLGDSAVYSQVIFQGDWNSFLEKNRENAESNGKEFDGRGTLTAAVQTLMLGVSLLAGAPVTAVANAGLTGTYGNFTKEDAQWFQTIQIDPAMVKAPPKYVVITKSNMNRRGKDMTWVRTIAFVYNDNLDAARLVMAQNIAESFTQLVQPEPGLTPELEEKARHLNDLLVAAKTAPSN